jgi:hypothetical protein
VAYLKRSEDKDAAGFLTQWTEYSRLQLLSLVTDVTFLFASFQKTMQSDSIHLFEVWSEVDSVIDKLHRMETAPDLIGGWEERLNAEVTFSENASDVHVPKTAHLHDIELTMKTRRRTEHHKFVSDRRGFDAIRAEILQSLITFLHDRLDMPELAGIKILEGLHCFTSLKCDSASSTAYNQLWRFGIHIKLRIIILTVQYRVAKQLAAVRMICSLACSQHKGEIIQRRQQC